MLKKLILAVGTTSLLLAVSACTTVRGLGQDLQSVANEVDEET
jgi:predicted small secreted protein